MTGDEEVRNPEVFQQPDQVWRSLLLAITFGTVAFGLFLGGVAFAILHLRLARLPGGRAAAPPSAPAAATVHRDLFAVPGPPGSPLAVEPRALERFGWVDRAQGVVHVPIDVAMDLVVHEAGGKP
jgi:hypothetical protein